MSRITLQAGHVARTRGATGTHREQEFARRIAALIASGLLHRGHQVKVIGADDPVPPGDVFIALHTDGSTNPARRGASVGYPDQAGERLARAWKLAHQRHGFPGGFLPDNYTDALRRYYGFGRARGYAHRFLAEHGTTTNGADEQWLFDHLPEAAQAHVDAIGAVVGHPEPAPTAQEDDMRIELYRDPRPPTEDDSDLVAFVPAIGRRRIEDPDELAYWRARGNIDPTLIRELDDDPRLAAQIAKLPWLEPTR